MSNDELMTKLGVSALTFVFFANLISTFLRHSSFGPSILEPVIALA